MRSEVKILGTHFAHVLEKGRIQEEPYEPAKRILVGYDLAAGGETALKSAVVLADRYRAAALRLHDRTAGLLSEDLASAHCATP